MIHFRGAEWGFVAVTLLVAGIVPIAESCGQPPRRQNGIENRFPETIRRVMDLPYANSDNSRQTLDMVLPKEPQNETLPVIVFIHGGAWRTGDKRAGIPRIARLVATGHFAGVSVGYRLSQEAQWPAQIHDCKAAIRWIRANAEKYGLDPERIGVWGSSAGGHLVSVLGTSGEVPEMDGQLGQSPELSSRVTCVVDFFGPTNFFLMN